MHTYVVAPATSRISNGSYGGGFLPPLRSRWPFPAPLTAMPAPFAPPDTVYAAVRAPSATLPLLLLLLPPLEYSVSFILLRHAAIVVGGVVVGVVCSGDGGTTRRYALAREHTMPETRRVRFAADVCCLFCVSFRSVDTPDAVRTCTHNERRPNNE